MLKRTSRKKKSLYSKGELNALVDDLIHPLLDQNIALNLVDLILHGLIEDNPPETALKFIRYSLPKIIAEYAPRSERARDAGENPEAGKHKQAR